MILICMDKVYLKGIIQNILNKEFKSSERRKIHEFNDRLNFCCFYCGDGKSDYKKRGNLYFNKLIYVCFNCGKKTNIDRLSKDFDQQIDPDKKLEMIEHLNNNITYNDYESEVIDSGLDKFIKITELENVFNTSTEINISEFKPIEKNGLAFNYLISRGITEQYHTDIYQAKYWFNAERYENVICLMNRRGDNVLGMQVRNFKDGKKRMFKIYNYESLYKFVKGVEEITDMDISELVIYNKLSYYFNILNISFDEKITIFEGYLDSLFYPNSVGVVGTTGKRSGIP